MGCRQREGAREKQVSIVLDFFAPLTECIRSMKIGDKTGTVKELLKKSNALYVVDFYAWSLSRLNDSSL